MMFIITITILSTYRCIKKCFATILKLTVYSKPLENWNVGEYGNDMPIPNYEFKKTYSFVNILLESKTLLVDNDTLEYLACAKVIGSDFVPYDLKGVICTFSKVFQL